MLINNKEVTVEELVNDIKPRDNMLKKYNNIYLSETDKLILDSYEFKVEKYLDIKSLIFDIEDYLNQNIDYDNEELEMVLMNLSEFNYYQNTNK